MIKSLIFFKELFASSHIQLISDINYCSIFYKIWHFNSFSGAPPIIWKVYQSSLVRTLITIGLIHILKVSPILVMLPPRVMLDRGTLMAMIFIGIAATTITVSDRGFLGSIVGILAEAVITIATAATGTPTRRVGVCGYALGEHTSSSSSTHPRCWMLVVFVILRLAGRVTSWTWRKGALISSRHRLSRSPFIQ